MRHELSDLSQNLKLMTKVYEKYELDSTNEQSNKDMFFN